jgi:hypothetical protein
MYYSMIMQRVLVSLFAVLFLVMCGSVAAQSHKKIVVGGIVTDSYQKVLANVHVVNTRQHSGTTTNVSGFFKIVAQWGDTLVFKYVGMSQQRFVVNDTSGTTILVRIELEVENVMLNEARISPYLSKKDLSYDNLPMDASENSRTVLRNYALATDKTRFPMVKVNFADLTKMLLKNRIAKPSRKQRQRSIRQQIMIEKLHNTPDTIPNNLTGDPD